jgi:hypothetical protein
MTKSKDPNAPTKPKSAYLLFCQKEREKVKKEMNEEDVKDPKKVISAIAKAWKKVSAKKKEMYQKKSDSLKSEYKKKLEEYKKNKPDLDSEDVEKDSKKRKRKGNTVKKKKKLKKDPNAPKKSMTSFMLFLKDRRPNILKKDPSLKVPEVTKRAGAEWNNLSVKEKKPYTKKAEELKKEYLKQKEKYDKKKMERELSEQLSNSSDEDSDNDTENDSDNE